MLNREARLTVRTLLPGHGFDSRDHLNNLEGQGPLDGGKTNLIKTAKKVQITHKLKNSLC